MLILIGILWVFSVCYNFVFPDTFCEYDVTGLAQSYASVKTAHLGGYKLTAGDGAGNETSEIVDHSVCMYGERVHAHFFLWGCCWELFIVNTCITRKHKWGGNRWDAGMCDALFIFSTPPCMSLSLQTCCSKLRVWVDILWGSYGHLPITCRSPALAWGQ